MKLMIILVSLLNVCLNVEAMPIDRIKKAGVLKVAMVSQASPPFVFDSSDSKMKMGFDVDLAKILADKLGVKLKLISKSNTFDQVVSSVNTESVDIGLSKLSVTSLRAQKVLFTSPYMNIPIGIVYNRLKFSKYKRPIDSKNFNDSEFKVGALKGSSFVNYIKKRFSNSKLIEFEKREDIYHSVASGKLDFTVVDREVIQTWKYNFPYHNLKTSTFMIPSSNDFLGVAVAKKDWILRDWIDIALSELKNTGELDELNAKYFKNDSWRQK